MKSTLYFDLEVNPQDASIQKIGAVFHEQTLNTAHLTAFKQFTRNATYICGHNIVHHDLKYLPKIPLTEAFFEPQQELIDTLLLSALLFSEKPYHALVKDYWLTNGTQLNEPLEDCYLTRKLLLDCIQKFQKLPKHLMKIYYFLLKGIVGFRGFFKLWAKDFNKLNTLTPEEIAAYIQRSFSDQICTQTKLFKMILCNPLELAYALSLISTENQESIYPPWIVQNYPMALEILKKLRNQNCKSCAYCIAKREPLMALQKYFGHDHFRLFDGQNLQEQVVQAALNNESLLGIFPTGGGKSISFQIPALMAGESMRALTVVISPLQSLMKDQVDVLEIRHDISGAVAINGLLSPLERSDAFQKVSEGGARLLYIAPESLRSKSILEMLRKRHIARFVIDEAHCFSVWGQDFRTDYFYIADFIKMLQLEKKLSQPIPVSCFTATAKPAVIDDITRYFQEKLGLQLHVFKSQAKRTNLHFSVYGKLDKDTKFQRLLQVLDQKEGPKIIYVARVKTATDLVIQLLKSGIKADAFYGKLGSRQKQSIQNQFMNGELDVIVATSAFGMGVDKDNVCMVIHYEISDSLENYVQEAGRAGRKDDLEANCCILFSEEDLDKHFALLNQTKLTQKEIDQIWRAIKNIKQKQFSQSTLELAKAAGWDIEISQLENRVKAAVAALEDCGYIQRGQNSARVFADSFLIRDVVKANQMIDASQVLTSAHKITAKRVFQHLISYASCPDNTETDIDFIMERLDLFKEETIRAINDLKELNILGDTKDLTARLPSQANKILKTYIQIETALLALFMDCKPGEIRKVFLSEINHQLKTEQKLDCNLDKLRDILRYWDNLKWVRRQRIEQKNQCFTLSFINPPTQVQEQMNRRHTLAQKALTYLQETDSYANANPDLVEFSLLDIQHAIQDLFNQISTRICADLLLYLNAIGALKLESGLLIYFSRMELTLREDNSHKKYAKEQYQKLADFYQHRAQQIHIVGEYAEKMMSDYQGALAFVDDYFKLTFKEFTSRYFPHRKTEINRPISERKFQSIFGALSTRQLEIIKTRSHQHILVVAGPGSGKTRVLVHKIASLLLVEDIKPEQMLMLTFSRTAALEFRSRLTSLVGKIAHNVDIFTYHGYAFYLLDQAGNLEQADTIVSEALEKLKQNELPTHNISRKSILVVDEYQDISEHEFLFLNAIVDAAGEIRMVVVGDDDQNIFEFRGSSVKYMQEFQAKYDAQVFYLETNYRSKANLVEFTNQYVRCLAHRMKTEPIQAYTHENGEIELVKYCSHNVLLPLVDAIIAHSSTHSSSSTAVLTATNEQAMLIDMLLRQNHIPSRLILSLSAFKLKNLLEVRTLTHYISRAADKETGLITNENWQECCMKVSKQFKNAPTLSLMHQIIAQFISQNQIILKSSWFDYITQIQIEDFFVGKAESIIVSTMHKAKGKEFDTVFLLLNDFALQQDDKKRALYVALTRAKQSLFIHTNQSDLDHINVNEMKKRFDSHNYQMPKRMFCQLSLKDVYLGHQVPQDMLRQLQVGDTLALNEKFDGLCHPKLEQPWRFSKAFIEKQNTWFRRGYRLEQANIGFIVLWFNKNSKQEQRIPLPRLVYSCANHSSISATTASHQTKPKSI